MTAVMPSFTPKANLDHYYRMKSRAGARDRQAEIVHQVRRGNMRQLFPDELNWSLQFDGVPIANFIDNVAHDLAESIAPLPALACASGKMKTDADLRRAEVKNRIGDSYWFHSKLELQMLRGADRYITYGFLPIVVEPDVNSQRPYIRIDNPRNAYYEIDRYGCCTVYAKRLLRSIDQLCAMFPEYASLIRKDSRGQVERGDTQLEMVRWIDGKSVTLMLPQRDGLILGSYEHKMSRTPVWIAERPGDSEDGESPRGQFDDVIWVQVARAIMSTLALEAAAMAVQAPIAAPSDMDEFPIGPHSILQSDDANKIHRVNLELPPTIFAENQNLDNELKTGSRYPDARTGGVQASVITGKGVEALLGTFDTQIKGVQMVLKEAFQQVTSMCFEMDEVWWPNISKTISGTISGASWELVYTPARDIAGRWTCTVTYGFAAGMHPSQSIVTMLQLEGAGLIAKGTTRDNLPFSLDTLQEERRIDIEGTREAIKQGLFAYVQSSGQMAAQGQDPDKVIKLALNFVKNLEDGKTVEDALDLAYQAQEQAEQEAAAQQQAEGPTDQEGGAAPGMGGDSLPPGVAPGQAGQPPGGMPTIANMIAGFRGNASLPVNQMTIQRRLPTGT